MRRYRLKANNDLYREMRNQCWMIGFHWEQTLIVPDGYLLVFRELPVSHVTVMKSAGQPSLRRINHHSIAAPPSVQRNIVNKNWLLVLMYVL